MSRLGRSIVVACRESRVRRVPAVAACRESRVRRVPAIAVVAARTSRLWRSAGTSTAGVLVSSLPTLMPLG